MKPVDQLFLVDRDGRGDCLRACVASILELDPHDVPDVGLFGWSWMQALVCYADITLIVPGEVGGYWIACGMGPRGIRHSVVYLGAEMAHDPHPSRAGLVGPVEDGFVLTGLKQGVIEWMKVLQSNKLAAERHAPLAQLPVLDSPGRPSESGVTAGETALSINDQRENVVDMIGRLIEYHVGAILAGDPVVRASFCFGAAREVVKYVESLSNKDLAS